MAAEATVKKMFFTRARTRSLTTWGGISILAAFTILLFNLTDDPAPVIPQVAEAVTRSGASDQIRKLPGFNHYYGKGRNIFAFAEPPRPKTAPPVIIKQPEPEPEPVKVAPPPPPPTVNTSGLILYGVIADKHGGGWAIVGGAGKYETIVKKGDKLKGSVVERIEPKQITLRNGKLTGTLKLRSNFKTFVSRRTSKKKSGENVVEREDVPRPKRRRKVGISIRSGANGITITRVRRTDIDVSRGDILLAVAGTPVSTMSQAVALIRKNSSQPAVTLKLRRNGKVISTKIPLEE